MTGIPTTLWGFLAVAITALAGLLLEVLRRSAKQSQSPPTPAATASQATESTAGSETRAIIDTLNGLLDQALDELRDCNARNARTTTALMQCREQKARLEARYIDDPIPRGDP